MCDCSAGDALTVVDGDGTCDAAEDDAEELVVQMEKLELGFGCGMCGCGLCGDGYLDGGFGRRHGGEREREEGCVVQAGTGDEVGEHVEESVGGGVEEGHLGGRCDGWGRGGMGRGRRGLLNRELFI